MKKRIELVLKGRPKDVEVITEILRQLSHKEEVVVFLEKTIEEKEPKNILKWVKENEVEGLDAEAEIWSERRKEKRGFDP